MTFALAGEAKEWQFEEVEKYFASLYRSSNQSERIAKCKQR